MVYADVAFTNYLMFEEQSLIKAIDTNLPDGIPNVALAEEAVKYAAELIPLVEDASLDTVWLGLRVKGDGAALGANRTSTVLLSATAASGPGDLVAYLTGSFGDVDVYFESANGFDATNGYRDDTVSLPPDAHTHLSWAFTKPGIYTLDLEAKLQTDATQKPIPIASDRVTFAVGVNPHTVPGKETATVLDSGHSDLTVDLATRSFEVLLDHEHGSGDVHQEFFPIADVIVEVPNKALHEIPGDPAYRFLGRAGSRSISYRRRCLASTCTGKSIRTCGKTCATRWPTLRSSATPSARSILRALPSTRAMPQPT
nr:choice-of-anchor M domain-containing protein [Leucobacter insecticola]